MIHPLFLYRARRRAPLLDRVFSLDSFGDGDGTALTSHVPDRGPLWSEGTGGTVGYEIQGHELTRADPVNRHAFIDLESADVTVSARVTRLENLVALLVRRGDSNHYWEVFYDFGNAGWQMSLVDGGPDSFKGPLLAGGVGVVTLSAKGNVITATSPGGESHSETDAALATNTQVGLIVNGFSGVASTLDAWRVVAS